MIYEDLIEQYKNLDESEAHALLIYKSRLSRAINSLDIDDEEVLDILSEICEDVSNRLQYSNKVGKTITLKVKYDDFTKITRSFSLEHPIYKAVDIRTSVYNLVKNLEKNKGKIRLLGVTVSNLSETEEEFKNITISEYLDNIKETTK